MRNTILILIIFINLKSLAQKKEFSLNSGKSIELRKTFGVSFPNVYLLTEKEFSLKKFDTIKTLTKEYIEKQKKEESIKKDSLNQFFEYSNLKKEYINLVSIKQNIDNFLNSNKRYKDKKQYLIDAQVSSDSLNKYKDVLYKAVRTWYIHRAKVEFIYADKNINSNKRSEYKQLKFNKNEFTEHLTQISKRIESLRKPSFNFKRPQSNSSISYSTKKEEKYNYELKEKEEIKSLGYQIIKPQIDFTKLNGDYKLLYKSESLVGNLDKNQLLLIENLRDINKSENELKSIYNSYIFQDINTNQIYFSKDKTVIDNYSISKELKTVYKKLKEKGFITKQIESNTYIIISNKKIRISENEVLLNKIQQNDYEYINKVSKSIDEFNSKVKLSKPLIIKLNNNIRAYKSGTLTYERLNSWKNENKKGKQIVNQFKKIIEIFEVDYLHHYLSSESIQTKTDLQNSVLASDIILGM